ncbi:MAG: polysaccharide biosynthesis protein [Arenicella sp.]
MPGGINKHVKTALYRWRVVLHDMLWIPFAWLGAYSLRYNFEYIPRIFLDTCITLLPYVVVAQIFVYFVVGVHRGEWRFVSLPDLTQIIKAVAFGTAMVALTAFVVTRLNYVPRSIFVLYAMILAVGLGGSRVAYRLFKDRHFSSRAGRKVVIIGAGSAGEQLVRDLRRNFPKRYNVLAFLDDDASKIGRQIHGVPVVASCDVIGDTVDRWGIDLALIAVPSANDQQMQRMVTLCEKAGIEFRTLPGVHELLSGKVSLTDLREVRIDDLLGREPVNLDWHRIKSSLAGKVVMISGAGGSIGSELSRQLAAIQPAHIILFEQSEYNLYRIEGELTERFNDVKVTPVLGDICDKVAVQNTFDLFKPNIVFHAAAYKHVPLLEGQVREAVKNNVLGTQIIADLAFDKNCEKFVLISTDKAVNPSSLMGACKRSGEIYCQMLASRSDTKFITVRFGNVLGSAGSVVPRFQQQIRCGGPVTVTHPDMTRYFMTITEATQLILEASVVGHDGRIYVLDMGQPVKIVDLARQLVLLSGKVPDEDIKIEFTGLRPGEKLTEELFHCDENLSDTKHDKLLLANTRSVNADKVATVFIQFAQAVDQNDCEQLVDGLKTLVPEYNLLPVHTEACKGSTKQQSA